MLCLNLESTDPYFNLAVDEYLLKNRNDDFLILGTNEKSIIIGKHQVAHRETNTKYITQNNIPVIRRISGGGTVFHDNGNLNFSFILKSEQGRQVDFMKYTLPVISFLSSLGVDAIFGGKNDLKINGLKISGNAEHVYHERVLHHGTLLFNTDLDLLRASIRKDPGNYNTRAVISNPSLVMNLKSILININDIYEFKTLMLKWFLENSRGSEIFHLTEEEIEKIKDLAEARYRTWQWNFSYGPDYHFTNRFRYEGKECFCSLFVIDGIIWECVINGSKELESACKKLIGSRHMVKDVQDLFIRENISIPGFDIFNFF
jgi:lipoate---protein ligase